MNVEPLDKAICELEFRRNPRLADELRELRSQVKNAYQLPCQIGDSVYAIRGWSGRQVVHRGEVSEMVFREGKDGMELVIAVRGICRGLWGEKIFGTKEDAENALKRR